MMKRDKIRGQIVSKKQQTTTKYVILSLKMTKAYNKTLKEDFFMCSQKLYSNFPTYFSAFTVYYISLQTVQC